jgi:hypothetical protein
VLANAQQAALSFLMLSLSPLRLYKIPTSAEEKLALFLGYSVGQIVPQTLRAELSSSIVIFRIDYPRSSTIRSRSWLNSDLRPFGVALESPASSGPERSRDCKGVFHELHVSAAPIVHFCED